jgi:NAD(P)-dependent dehydrogenase (short-subunit alcohol dehydrogenase family)
MSAHDASKRIDFDGQVAIVTGAGGGLGLCIARELARRGAAVLVNDYGGDTRGGSPNRERAETAAAAIRAAGGRAVADATAVGTPESARVIVARALKSFGQVDILVNNAGIARPCPFTEARDEDLELELRTNLLGPYALMRAAWVGMRARGYGRILNVSSNASLGIGHNTSYATAKAGLLGLTLDTAAEGKALGICVNALMPVAYTRLIEGIPDPAFVAWFRKYMAPEKVAAAVAYFLSRESKTTGVILSAGGGRLARLVFAENEGLVNAADAEATRANLADVLDVSQVRVLESSADELGLYSALFPFDGDGASPALDTTAVVGAGQKDSER